MFAKKSSETKNGSRCLSQVPNDKLSDMDHGIHFSFWNGLHKDIKRRWIFIQEE